MGETYRTDQRECVCVCVREFDQNTEYRLRPLKPGAMPRLVSQPPPSTPGPKTEKKLDPMSVDKEEGSATKAMSVREASR